VSPSQRSKIQFATLVISVAIIAMVFGIILDDKVVPETKKPLMTEETAEKENVKAIEAEKEIKQTLQQQAVERRKQQSAQLEKLDQKAEATMEKANGLISKTDEAIAKAGLPEPVSANSASPQNKEIAERMAKARERLDKLKNKNTNNNPGEI
jgi:flagellar biosynthesis/type III secretory pathway M-ring protein FliF/YscJ